MNNQLPVQTGLFNISSLEDAYRFAHTLANSNLVPSDYRNKPDDIVIAMQMGSELGLKPLQSLQGIAVIRGKPTIWGDALVAICQGSGLLEDITEEVTDEGATVTVTRTGHKPHTVTFTVEDAETANLWGNAGPWKQYPKRMMKNRARAFALRDKFADVLKGFGITEEEKDRVLDVTPSSKTPSEVNDSVNALLQSLPDDALVANDTEEEVILPEYDISDLMSTINKIECSAEIRGVGEKIREVIDDPNINISEENVAALRTALKVKRGQCDYEELLQKIDLCEDMESIDGLRATVEEKAHIMHPDAVKILTDALNEASEEIGAQG